MNWEDLVVKLNVKARIIDYNHPLNIYETESFTGSGFFISNQLILTCYHVIQDAINIEVLYKQTINIEGKIKNIFPDDDLAVIELKTPVNDAKILKFKVINNRQIDEVFTIGFPLNSANVKITKGIISGYQDSLIQTDASLNHGNSGGPLVIQEDNTYKIIGVNVSKMTGSIQKTGYVVPIYRFIILQNLISIYSPIVIKKPCNQFSFQRIIQNELRKFIFEKYSNTKLLTANIGIRFTVINPEHYLNKHIKVNEILIGINSSPVDNLGKIKFDFYPEKISIDDIGLWFVEGNELDFHIYNSENNKYRIEKIKLQISKHNLTKYFNIENYPKPFVNKNGLIFNIVTEDHIDNLNKLNITSTQIIKIFSRFLQQKDRFTVYLADLDYSKKFIKYPIGEIIIEINGEQFNNYEEFIKITETPITYIKTIDNEIFFV